VRGHYPDLMGTKKLGPVRKEERRRYRARILSDTEARRPTPVTATKVCELVGVEPVTLRAARDREDVGAQAFVVALDAILGLGDRKDQLTTNTIIGALGRYWSLSYQAAMLKGVTVTYDMTEQRLKDMARELTVAGVNVEAIWSTLTGKPGKATRLPDLYELKRVSGQGHARGRRVELHDSELLDDVRYTILRDPQYERPVRHRLVRAEDKVSELPLRQDVCEERGYNIVNLNQRSRDILRMLEASRVRFYVEQFRADFEAMDDYSNDRLRADRNQLKGVVANLRAIYEATAGIMPERDGEAVVFRFGGRQEDGYITIRSRFFRAVNRRFEAADFWPEHVPGDLRDRWFGLDPITPRRYALSPDTTKS
jgi:hypothetical protein